jgi:hypothetical protein
MMDENVKTTEREVYTIIAALSSTGGFAGLVAAIAHIFVVLVENSLFVLSILKKLNSYSGKNP